MSDNMVPGPYKTDNGELVVVLDGALDDDGDLVAARYLGIRHYQWSHYKPSNLNASDVWPDWWPFPNTPIPERELRVGDFIRYEGEYVSGTFEIMGLRFGQVQAIGCTGESFSEPMPLHDSYKRVERPSDWPTE